ncbi:hypothetical protein BSKO_11648 [Bryopsis sp. KO-2023]|nr:hypothetical protein BSKO_11648 [Bryopsis sp. KO-2023]
MMHPPASKSIPGTGFLVDGFKFANPSVRGYFLSHAHSDHYTGLTESWEQGPIYCSNVTARLIAHMLGVDKKYLHVLPMNQPQNVDGVEVILVDANHCPGAVQFLFLLPNGRKFVHCGDMRFCPEMLDNPFVQRFRGADAIFLDTTYCNPKHTFPIQDESIRYVADTIYRYMKEQREGGPAYMFMISTYGIGKERILLEVSGRCDTRICVAERKLGVMGCLDWERPLESIFTTDMKVSNVHVVKWGVLGETWPYFRPNFVNMESARVENGVDKVIGFVPTGWVHATKDTGEFPICKKGECEVHLVPYSEHSSYSELREFVKHMKPEKIIPTVGVNGDDVEKKEASILKHFRNLVNETASKAKFIENMQRGSGQLKASDEKNCGEPPSTEVREEAHGKDDSSGPKPNTPEENKEMGKDVGNRIDDMAIDLTLNDDLRIDIDMRGVSPAGCGEELETGLVDPEFETPRRKVSESNFDGDDLTFPQCGGSNFSPKWNLAAKGDLQLESSVNLGNQASVESGKADLVWNGRSSRDPVHEAEAVSTLNSCDTLANAIEMEVEKRTCVNLEESNAPEMELMEHGMGEVESGSKSIQQGVEIKPEEKDVEEKEVLVIDGSGELGEQNEALSQVLAILSGMVSKAKAESLLRQAGGKADVAINAFYENMEIGTPRNVKKLTQSTLSPMTGSKRPLARKPNRKTPRKRPRRLAGQRSIRSYFAPQDISSNSQDSRGLSLGGGCSSKGVTTLGEGLEAVGASGAPEEMTMASKSAGDDIRPSARNPYACEEPNVSLSQADLDDIVNSLEFSGEETQGKKMADDIMDGDMVLPVPEAIQPSTHEIPRSTNEAEVTTKELAKNREIGPPSDVKNTNGEGVKETVLSPVPSYDPVSNACWGKGEPPPYLHLARALQEVASTTKRLKITDGLTNMFRSVLALSPEHLLETVYLTCGKIAPDHVGGELNVGGNIVSVAITEATGCSRGRLRELYSEIGDLGDVAQACKQSQRLLVTPAPLTIPGVFHSLRQVSLEQGTGSTERRKKIITAMLRACRDCEIRYLVRTLIQNLRIGASWLTVVGALGRAIMVHNDGQNVSKERLDKAAAEVCELYHLCPSFDALVPALLEGGIELAKQRCTLVPGVPVKPMLAKISAGIADALTNVKEASFLAEFKYDGVRAQIHIDKGGQVHIFSRRCETKTEAYPDVVSAIKDCVASNVGSIILDAELVAVDRAKGNRLKAFQELSHRSRNAVEESDVTISVCAFVFDILYLNGEVLLKQSLRKRRAAMEGALSNLKEGFVSIATSMEMQLPAPAETGSNDGGGENEAGQPNSSGSKSELEHIESEVREFLVSALSIGAEGLMLKLLDGTSAGYESSKRSDHWLKIKSDYCEGLHDSLDVVPIGAWRGQGRKVKWYSPFLLAIWDPETEEFQSICRCMSGFSDAFYEEATARLSEKAIPGPKSYYRTQEQPSTWFEPSEVWEIKGADLTISPVHQAALGRVHKSKGCGLRFPRFIKVREDKGPMDASTPDAIEMMFLKQSRRVDSKGENREEKDLSDENE